MRPTPQTHVGAVSEFGVCFGDQSRPRGVGYTARSSYSIRPVQISKLATLVGLAPKRVCGQRHRRVVERFRNQVGCWRSESATWNGLHSLVTGKPSLLGQFWNDVGVMLGTVLGQCLNHVLISLFMCFGMFCSNSGSVLG